MKRLLGILAITALAASAFAQGTVAFQNQTGLVRQWTTATDPTPMTVPVNGAYVELISAPAGTALTASFGTLTASGFAPNFSSLAGFVTANPGWSFAVGTPPAALMAFGPGLFNGGGLTIPGIPAGGAAEYVVVGWTGAFTTYEAAYASGTSFLGISAIDNIAKTGDPTATPPGTPAGLRPTFTGVLLAPVPEPTTFALAGLGLAALLVFRRRS